MRKQKGFTLIEVLVAMFILAIGILGAGAMQMVGLQGNQGAYYRTQAIYLSGDIIDRMRANPSVITPTASPFDAIDTDGTIPSDPGCKTGSVGCTPAALAQTDISEWGGRFTQAIPILPAGRGRVSRTGNNFTVTINWSARQWTAGERADGTQTYAITVSL